MIKRERMRALIYKEMIQFLRARGMLLLIFYLYTVEVLMCTYAMSFDVRNLSTVVADFDHSRASRAIVGRLSSSGYFRIEHQASREDQVADLLDRGNAVAAIVIPPDFSRRLVRRDPVSIQLLLDGSNASTASVAQGYARQIIGNYAMEQVEATRQEPVFRIEHRPRVWYNSELKYSYFMVLSMISLAGMMVGVITAAAGIVREKEAGTIEQMLVSPVRPGELIAAKMLPPLVVDLIALLPSLGVAAWVGVPMRGNLALFFLFSAIFLASSMGIGILIATIANTLQQALLISFLALFPLLFLSGTVTPLESMPPWLQFTASLSPLRHYMDAVLGIFFKGVGLDILWPRLAAMTLIGIALLGAGLLRFRKHFG